MMTVLWPLRRSLRQLIIWDDISHCMVITSVISSHAFQEWAWGVKPHHIKPEGDLLHDCCRDSPHLSGKAHNSIDDFGLKLITLIYKSRPVNKPCC